MSAVGAFHPVQARRTLARPTQSESVPSLPHLQSANSTMTSPEKAKKVNWPLGVRTYVQKAFDSENYIPGIRREEMEQKLKETITEASNADALGIIDWDSVPLPQEMIQNDRKKSKPAPAPAPWHDRTPYGQGPDIRASTNLGNGTQSHKRKSLGVDEAANGEDGAQPPWRKKNKGNIFEDRVTFRPAEHGATSNHSSKFNNGHDEHLEKRQKRFENVRLGVHSPKKPSGHNEVSPEPAAPIGPVVGHCQDIEKRYFRLNGAPNPALVRPLNVLQRTLDFLKKKWKQENNYAYICDQFKSLRQDLTVQHIKNEFTVTAYEIHARIALEKGDLGEYNQCQTQLRALYSQHLGGHPMEFKAYRVLYFIHTCNRTDMNDILAELTPTEKRDPAVKHALGVRSALALGNYHRFFRLYLETPNMGAYLMDMFVVRERLAALANICKAYKPDVKIRFITEELGFESDGESVQFLVDHNAQALIEEREDGIRLLSGKAGQLFETSKTAAFRKVDIKGQI
ncbi:MAG: hypothetical protein M4579_004742 [Chaenotheca gracillima]|nr:MAG: hypothetical protein M4579_004742 [Chaenotheca gracillima]